MQKISLIKFKLFFLFFIFIFFSQQLSANENIIINGNKNISSKTIYSFAPRNIHSLDPKLLNDFQKNLSQIFFSESHLKGLYLNFECCLETKNKLFLMKYSCCL